MSQSIEQKLRTKVWNIINTVETRGLFIHSDMLSVKKGSRYIKIPTILGTAVLNALVPNSAMLLVGGHGGGKTTLLKNLGRMFTGKRLAEIDECILRGHPQLTEEKVVATLKAGKLIKEGVEEVVWRKFITSFWKIIDEVNRLTPYIQDILLSLLAEGEVKYYDAAYRLDTYSLFGTMNPRDVGAFEIPLPFLDRFGIAVPVTMPDKMDLETILKGPDEKLYGYDEEWQVPKILTESELVTIWKYVDVMTFEEDAKELIVSIVRELNACIRADKSRLTSLQVGSGLCVDCHFNTEKSVCNKVVSPASVRVAKDMMRYSKALAWLVGEQQVTAQIVKTIAPFVIWHRVKFSERELTARPYYGDAFKFAQYIIDLAVQRYVYRKPAYEALKKIEQGKISNSDIKKIEMMAKSDVVISVDILPRIKEMQKKEAVKLYKEIDEAIQNKNIESLVKIHRKILEGSSIANRSTLLIKIEKAIHEMTVELFILKEDEWEEVWPDICAVIPEKTKAIKETLGKTVRKRIVSDDVSLNIISVTTPNNEREVYIEVSGWERADKIKRILGQYSR